MFRFFIFFAVGYGGTAFMQMKNPTAGFGSGVWKDNLNQHPTAALHSSRAVSSS
jgi:hypothetical protein